MKLIYLLSIFLCLVPLSVGNEVIIANIGDETLFEGRALILRCQSQLRFLSWWKGSSKMAEFNDGRLTVEPLYEHLEFSHQFIFFILNFTSLRVIDSGSYYCRGHGEEETLNATVNLQVYENGQCVTNYEGPQEYLTDDMIKTLFVKCNYPMATSLQFTSVWYDTNSIQLNTISSSSTDYTYTTTAIYSIPEGQNGSVVTCYVNEVGDLPPGPSSNIFSCSVGPVYFFDAPSVLIETLHSGVIYKMEEITLSCRLVPATIITELTWNISPGPQRSEITKSGGISYLTLSKFVLGLNKTVTATCTTVALGQTYSSTYSFVVREMTTAITPTESTESKTVRLINSSQSSLADVTMTTPEPDVDQNYANNDSKYKPKDDEPTSLILVIVILSVVVAVLLGLLLQIAIWCLIRKRDTSRKSSPTTSVKRSSIYTNEGFNEDGIYNDLGFLPMSPKLSGLSSERCVEIKDDEDSCDETLEDNPKMKFQRPSSVSTFSDVSSQTTASQNQLKSYSSVVRDESQYDLPPVSSPIYATACKQKRKVSASSNSNRRMIHTISSQHSQQEDSSDESGVSVSYHKSSEEYFELNEEPIRSTKC